MAKTENDTKQADDILATLGVKENTGGLPSIKQSGERTSKYQPLYDRTFEVGSVQFDCNSQEQAQGRGTYLRKQAPEGIEVRQRGVTVYLFTTEALRVAEEAEAAEAASN